MEPVLRVEESSDKSVAVAVKSTKEELITNIKEWIKLDNDIAKAKSDIKEKTARKKSLTENLVVVMKSNSIDCFDINGGALIYKQKKTKKPISAKYLLAELQKYYKDKPEVATDLTKQLLDNRELSVKDEICRKINK
jgi:ribosomal protein S24E